MILCEISQNKYDASLNVEMEWSDGEIVSTLQTVKLYMMIFFLHGCVYRAGIWEWGPEALCITLGSLLDLMKNTTCTVFNSLQ